MSESCADHSASQLELCVLEGHADPAQFETYALAELSTGTLRAHVIGASHWLAFDLPGGTRLHEVLACKPPLHAGGVRFRAPAGELPERLRLDLGGSGSYVFGSTVLTDSAAGRRLDGLEKRIGAAARDPETIGLSYRFPAPGDPPARCAGGFAPLTLVWAHQRAAGDPLVVETAHAYPRERAVVFSRTEVVRGS